MLAMVELFGSGRLLLAADEYGRVCAISQHPGRLSQRGFARVDTAPLQGGDKADKRQAGNDLGSLLTIRREKGRSRELQDEESGGAGKDAD